MTHYDVRLEPRLESRTLTGTVTLSVVVHSDDVAPADATITLNRGRLEIDGVQEDGRAAPSSWTATRAHHAAARASR